MFLVFLLYALFAGVCTIAKVTLQYSQPVFLVGSRMFLAGILMLAYQYIFHREGFKFIQKKNFWLVLKLAAFNIYLTNVFEFWGLLYLDSFKTCFIFSLSPFFAALFSYFIFSETLTTKKWIGLSIGFAGIIPMLLGELPTNGESKSLLFLSWPEVILLASVMCSVYGWILLCKLVREEGYSTFMANGLSMMLGGSLALIHSYGFEDWNPTPVNNYAKFLMGSIALLIISNFICYNLYGSLLKRFSATFMSFAGFATPMFTALFGWFFLGEVITWSFYLSAAIVFVGLYTFSQEELQMTIRAQAQVQE